MKKLALLTLVILCLAPGVQPREQSPPLLLHAAQCLTSKKFLLPSKAAELTFGYVLDEKSYPGDKVIYVVKYAAATRSDGDAYAVFVSMDHGHEAFSIQNNTTFVLAKSEPTGVSFVNPPLGGDWTQEHLASAIRKIEMLPRFTIRANELARVTRSITCEAYTDPQPNHGHK